MAQGQLLAHHPGRVTGGRNQAQNHADDQGTTAVRLRDADHGNTAERHGHPRDQPTRERLVQQPAAAEQREENRADVDEHCGGASVGLLLPAGAVRDNEPVLGRELLNGSRKWAHWPGGLRSGERMCALIRRRMVGWCLRACG
jgi:hypothetical protein